MLHLLFLVAFLRTVLAGDSGSFWTSPQPGALWTAGTTQTVAWTTDFTASYPVNLWQQWPQGGGANDLGTIYLASAGSTGAQSFSWVVDYRGANLTYSNLFFIWANSDGTTAAWNSGYFNITAAPAIIGSTVTQSSTSSTRPTTTGRTTSPTSLSTTASGASQASASPNSTSGAPATSSTTDPNGTTSNTSVIGIGVGVGVGVAVVIIAAVVAFFLLRKRRRARAASAGASAAHPPHHSRGPSELPPNSVAYEPVAQNISEMPGSDHGAYGYQDSKTGSKWGSPVYEVPGNRPHAVEVE